MKSPISIRHEFVTLLPDKLAENTLYVSIEYSTAAHLCMCGCRTEIQTPLSPVEWRITFDGESVSLYPSIGNWSLKCKSHYWIEKNQVRWAKPWSKQRIENGRETDQSLRRLYYGNDTDSES